MKFWPLNLCCKKSDQKTWLLEKFSEASKTYRNGTKLCSAPVFYQKLWQIHLKHEVNNTMWVKLGKMIELFEKKKENLDSMLQGLPSSTENQVRETFFSVSKVNTVFWDIFRLFQHFVIIAD